MKARIVLGFDFGLKRIGIAAGDTVTRTAAPLKTIAHLAEPDWPAILACVKAAGPDLLVVGAPYNDDGSPGRIAGLADAFAAQLAERCRLEVARVDERYSSTAAASLLREQRASGQRRKAVRKGDLDSAAAAVRLESWLQQPH